MIKWQRRSATSLSRFLLAFGIFCAGYGLATQPAGAAPFAYVANAGSNSVSVIDTRTSSVVATVPVPARPAGIAITPDGKFVYVAVGGNNSVAVIDAATNTVVAAVPVGAAPNEIAITPDGKLAYVSTPPGLTNVSIIDTKSNTVAGSLHVGGSPGSFLFDLAITPNGKFMYVTAAGEGAWIVDTATNTQVTLVRIPEPLEVAITPNGALAYISTNFGISVAVIDTPSNTVTTVVRIPGEFTSTSWVTVSPDGRFAYVVDNSRNFTVINTATNIVDAALPLGFAAARVAVTPSGKFAYVLNRAGNSVAVVDANNRTLVGHPIAVGVSPTSLVMTPFAFPETNILDSFNRSNGKLGGNWSGEKDDDDSFRIRNNEVLVRDGGVIYWQPESFGADQEAFVKLTKIDPNGTRQGVVLKAQSPGPAAAPNHKFGAVRVVYNAKQETVQVKTLLPRRFGHASYPSIHQKFNDGDQFGAQVHANGAVDVFRNGKKIGTVTLNSADQAFFNHNGGRIGLQFSESAEDAVFDDFGGGTLVP